MPQTHTVLRWSAYEHDHIERTRDWFWALGVVAISIALTSILLQNYLFALLILVAAATIALLAQTPPVLVQFEISERGIRIAGKLHRYAEIISFWVEQEHGGQPLLLLDTTKLMHPNIIIPLEQINPGIVRAYLKEHIEEVHMKEPVAHKILEFFGL